MDTINCPLCGNGGASKQSAYDHFGAYFRCPKCKFWGISGDAIDVFEDAVNDLNSRAKIRNFVFRLKQKSGEETHVINIDELNRILGSELPSIDQQVENLIYFLGKTITPGETASFNSEHIYREIGCVLPEGIKFLMEALYEKNWVKSTALMKQSFEGVELTLEGRQQFEILKKQHESKTAFMAMQYGDPKIDQFFQKLQVAVGETGFTLFRLDGEDQLRTGLIDERMKLSIKASRFIISDLTKQNRGAYWEAGYAEGLGKKVIFTCRDDDFKNIHFDTSHMFAVKWSEDTIEKALEDVKVLIRNEFFEDVRKDNMLDFATVTQAEEQ